MTSSKIQGKALFNVKNPEEKHVVDQKTRIRSRSAQKRSSTSSSRTYFQMMTVSKMEKNAKLASSREHVHRLSKLIGQSKSFEFHVATQPCCVAYRKLGTTCGYYLSCSIYAKIGRHKHANMRSCDSCGAPSSISRPPSPTQGMLVKAGAMASQTQLMPAFLGLVRYRHFAVKIRRPDT